MFESFKDFNKIKAFVLIGMDNSVTHSGAGDDYGLSGQDVVAAINGKLHEMWYTRKRDRAMLKQIEKHFLTMPRNAHLERKARLYFEELKSKGAAFITSIYTEHRIASKEFKQFKRSK